MNVLLNISKLRRKGGVFEPNLLPIIATVSMVWFFLSKARFWENFPVSLFWLVDELLRFPFLVGVVSNVLTRLTCIWGNFNSSKREMFFLVFLRSSMISYLRSPKLGDAVGFSTTKLGLLVLFLRLEVDVIPAIREPFLPML